LYRILLSYHLNVARKGKDKKNNPEEKQTAYGVGLKK